MSLPYTFLVGSLRIWCHKVVHCLLTRSRDSLKLSRCYVFAGHHMGKWSWPCLRTSPSCTLHLLYMYTCKASSHRINSSDFCNKMEIFSPISAPSRYGGHPPMPSEGLAVSSLAVLWWHQAWQWSRILPCLLSWARSLIWPSSSGLISLHLADTFHV